MLMPTVFKDNFFDDFFDFPMENFRGQKAAGVMQTDVAEKENEFELTMNVPGFDKENIKAELKDGYLVVSANTSNENEEKDEEGHFLRRERYTGSCSRSFYVGEDVKEEDIKAKFENGTLKLIVPKKQPTPQVEDKKYIAIEG